MDHATMQLDLNELVRYRKDYFVDVMKTIKSSVAAKTDCLLHTAGLMSTKASDFSIFAVNATAPLLLTFMMIPVLLRSSLFNPAVVFISSSSHLRAGRDMPFDCIQQPLDGSPPSQTSASASRMNKNATTAYAQAKLFMMLVGVALFRRLHHTGLRVKFVHPGLVDTTMLQEFFGNVQFPGRGKLLLSGEESASRVLAVCAESTSLAEESGDYSHGDGAGFFEEIRDYRELYYVGSKKSPQRCTNLLNDIDYSEECYTRFLQSIPKYVRDEIAGHMNKAAGDLDGEVQRIGTDVHRFEETKGIREMQSSYLKRAQSMRTTERLNTHELMKVYKGTLGSRSKALRALADELTFDR
jgi:NAD(P)-dependent dehydrogenase (short-subunit alcohol dehydrogenase family)